jgi:hypothetical protein
LASAPADTARPEPVPEKAATPKNGAAGKTTQNSTSAAKPKPTPTPKHDDVPRPPRGIFPSGGSPFGFFR